MTREVGDRILKDANGDISDHLRNHIHLTNCIHLKNHMHKHSPILSDRSLIRDLAVLQRSRSLRDPSMSPPSMNSPSAIDLLSKRREKDTALGNGRRSVDMERRGGDRGFSGSSPLLASLPRSKVGPGEVSRRNDVAAPVSDQSKKSGVRETRKVKKEESSGKNMGTETKDKDVKQIGRHREDNRHLKTLSERLNEVRLDTDDMASSHIRSQGRHTHPEKPAEEAEETIRSSCSGLNRVKRRKFRGARRNRAGQNEMPMSSKSSAQGTVLRNYHMEGREEECAEQNVTRAPQNGCGIPWNWSRIHHRGKNFLDIAGRSLSCGLSDPKLKKGGQVPRERDFSDAPVMNSDCSSSSSKPNAEALPLLVDASGSLESTDNAAWVHDYSGELGIFADNLLKHEIDGTDIASEARSSDQSELRGHRNGSRHWNFTQKYMPRTFRDLVGQNLVAQALSNAVTKRKVGLLYVFYGPHGTGKTACARILARALNCRSLENPKPCGFCHSCISYDMSKSRNIREIGSVGNFDFESIMDLLDNMIVSQLPSQYRVVIFDDCGNLSPDCWSAISKVIDRGPRHVVFVLVCLSLDVLPHIIISRCQKFFFPKLKDADIIYTLQWIATKEEIEIDKDALKLIASRSDGSLRDAEMTLDQLSLLGQRISVPLVQELVGLISDEKLVDLLDLALSADTINTVKNLREIMESGVEPLALMSQLATVITDILAGSYDFVKVRSRRKFFRQQGLSKEDMEKLRQALKTLSEAEKQLRMSNDRLTWLTAALLQLAPDQQYLLPTPSANSSLNFSPVGLSNDDQRDRPKRSNAEMPNNERKLPTNVRIENLQQTSGGSGDKSRVGPRRLPDKLQKKIEEVWLEVLEKIQINDVKQFMYQEGKLISVSFGAAPTVELMFSSHLTKSKAEKFRMHISRAFESVLGSPVTIEIRYESKKDTRAGYKGPLLLPASQDMMMSAEGHDDISRRQLRVRDHLAQARLLHFDPTRLGRSEIVEIEASPLQPKGNEHLDDTQPDRRRPEEQNQSQSLVRSKVSLSHVIQQGEGCMQRSGWSMRKAVSIAEKLEQENLRLEPRSRSLLCWRASRVTRRKLSRFKVRTRKPQALLRYVSCGKCLSARSPR